MLLASGRARRIFFPIGRNAGQTRKALRLPTEGLLFRLFKTERLPRRAPEQTPGRALPLPRGSAAARSWRARSLKTVTVAALAFLDLPFSRSYC
jgi:hypothetical protein